MSNSNIRRMSCQAYYEELPSVVSEEDKLVDLDRQGKDRHWSKRKLCGDYLALAYDECGKGGKADLVRICCRNLAFAPDKGGSGRMRLSYAWTCRVRLCPICSWRRSLKNFWTAKRVTDYIGQHSADYGHIQYIFLTLTVKNCVGDDLSAAIDTLYAAVKRLYERKEVRRYTRGMIRCLEVTHNCDVSSSAYDTYHPHIHATIAVGKDYFENGYIKRDDWRRIWRECLGVDYDPQIDVRAVRPKVGEGISGAIAEVSKYASKPKDYLNLEDWDMTLSSVRVLDAALHGRRLINYSGIFRSVKALLQLEDVDDGDLVAIGEEDGLDVSSSWLWYHWYGGLREYYRIT